MRSRITQGFIYGSVALIAMLVEFEGRVLDTYKDVAGVMTICAGISAPVYGQITGTPLKMGMSHTTDECIELEKKAVYDTQKGVDQCLTNREVSQDVFDALSSFAYNVGTYGACNSQAMKQINLGSVERGCSMIAAKDANLNNEMLNNWNWAVSGGKKWRGLKIRRWKEANHCLGV